MRILSIETSCDETGIAVLEYDTTGTVTVLGNALASQIELHAPYGGVFPALAKRAHAEKIVPLLTQALDEAMLLEASDMPESIDPSLLSFLDAKETTLREHIAPFLTYYARPAIDYIAVTVGPGLEPALWVGINTARALSALWGVPVIPINHMEGHIVTAAITQKDESVYTLNQLSFPLISLLVSGGHTELVASDSLGSYRKIGQTRDDAVGEAFDKVARVLGLPYPGGPKVSALARAWREVKGARTFELPRPMMHSGDLDFSFSGIKTAVLYAARDKGELSDDDKSALACEFEDAVVDVLVHKTLKALEDEHAQTLIVGGGVASNTHLREVLSKAVAKQHPDTTLLFPEPWLATDNAIMIGLAACAQLSAGYTNIQPIETLKADGNLSL